MAVKKVQRRAHGSRQKLVQQTLKNKGQQKHEAPASSTKNKKALVIAQEIKFARLLSNNDKRVRDKVLKNLKKWLTVRSKSSFAFTEADFMRLWKGLFYCMWMSDKPLIQEELAESLSKIVHCFDVKDVVILYTTCTLNTLATEWFGIDRYRLDKFAMLVRRIVRQTFEVLRARSWDMDWVKDISQMFGKLLEYPKSCLGFGMHLVEVYLEELSKVSCGEIPEEIVTELVKPFVVHLAIASDERLSQHIMKHVFRHLIFQSDVGLDYMEKFRAWRQAGFPAGHIDAMQKIEVSDEEGEIDVEREEEGEGASTSQGKQNIERPMDPRAGKVDVELPQIPFNPEQIINLLKDYRFHPSTSTNSRRQIARLIAEFSKLSQNEMPLGIKEIEVPKKKRDKSSKLAALRLLKFDEELYSDNLPHKRKRKKNGNLIEEESSYDESSDATIDDDDVFDEDLEEILQKKKKKIQIENTVDNSMEADVPESSTSVQISNSKKKNNKAEKRRQTNCEADAQNPNSKLEKVTTISANLNNASKKIKSKQTKASAGNKLKATPSVKKKKTAKLKTCGSWDISDCTEASTPTSLINGNVEWSEKMDTSQVTNKPLVKNMLNKNVAWLVPVIKKIETDNMTTPEKTSQPPKSGSDSSTKKRVKIVLQRNTAQHTSEYIQQIRQSPAIPFDANKKPLASVLKASPIPSPINPFYKRNLK